MLCWKSKLRASALLAAGFVAMLLCHGTLVAAQSSSTSRRASSAFCRTSATAESSVASQDGFTEAWLDIGSYVCGNKAPRKERVRSVDTQVRTVAFAVARAFAQVTAQCRAEGNAEVRAQALAAAQAEATAIGEAVAGIFASAEVCKRCSAAIDATSRAAQELVAKAVAEAWTELYIFSDEGQAAQTQLQRVTSDVVVERVAEVLTSITAQIRASANNGCRVRAINEARVGDFFAVCALDTRSNITQLVEIDAVAEAGASVSVFACDGGGEAEFELDLIVSETAVAVAAAVAQAEAVCSSAGGPDTQACGLSETSVQKVARAQARAFAEAAAEAQACDCAVSVASQASVMEDLWAEAATNAYAETCSSSTGASTVREFQRAFEERTLAVTARVILSAIAEVTGGPDVCRVTADACAARSPQCARRFRQCAGGRLGDDVLPCCDPDDRCIGRGGTFRCRDSRTRRAGDETAACNLNLKF